MHFPYVAVCQNLVPLVNIKIAGKWMFIPLKMVLIGIDPYPCLSIWRALIADFAGQCDFGRNQPWLAGNLPAMVWWFSHSTNHLRWIRGFCSYLVGGIPTPLKNMKVNGKDDNPYIMENKKCSKPPTSYLRCSMIFRFSYFTMVAPLPGVPGSPKSIRPFRENDASFQLHPSAPNVAQRS